MSEETRVQNSVNDAKFIETKEMALLRSGEAQSINKNSEKGCVCDGHGKNKGVKRWTVYVLSKFLTAR